MHQNVMMKERKINPAFAAAHGLSLGGNDPTKQKQNSGRIELALKEARATGKLLFVDAGASTPLPSNLFELRASLQVNLSMDQQQSLNQYTEESLTVVDFSDNPLITGTVDERFAAFQRAQQLRFKRCQWSSMTLSLTELECLSVLDLSGNLLTKFDMSLLPSNLQELNLSGNQLQDLKSSDDSVTLQLKALDISNNQLVELSNCNISCPALRNFECHHNRFSKFPPTFLISAQHSVESIDASCNLIAEALDFSKYKNLKTAKAALNRLTAVPTIPTSLIMLDVSTNMIKDIQGLLSTDHDESVLSLVDLMLHDNHLSEINADVIEKCINLKRLDISSNNLKNLPYQLALLPKIETVRMAANPLFTFKRSDVESNPSAVLEVLRRRAPKQEEGSSSSNHLLSSVQNHSIDLSVPKGRGQGFTLKAPVPDLNQLVDALQASPKTATAITQKLALSGFETIPEKLFSLIPNASHIIIPGNGLSTFPATLATSCSRLQSLDISGNILSSLSPFSHLLTWSNSIKHLNLSSNRIVDFPIEMLSQLVVLESLNLSSNKLEFLDRCTWLPSTLTNLELSENRIEDIHKLVWTCARCCPNIQTLRITRNKVAKIPLVLGLFLDKSLTSLDLRFNPQQAVRHAILEKSCKDQLLYLKNRLTKEQAEDALKKLGQQKSTPADAKQPETVRTGAGSTETKTSNLSATTANVNEGIKKDSAEVKAMTEKPATKSEDSADDPERQAALSLIAEYQEKIHTMQKEMDTNFSLSQAKRYAMKKQIALERSKMIREERKLGLRK
jgi:Leucine-rich repeat (LRR) protein